MIIGGSGSRRHARMLRMTSAERTAPCETSGMSSVAKWQTDRRPGVDQHIRERFRAGYRSGHIRRLHEPFQHGCRTVFSEDPHLPAADDRGFRGAGPQEVDLGSICLGETFLGTGRMLRWQGGSRSVIM